MNNGNDNDNHKQITQKQHIPTSTNLIPRYNGPNPSELTPLQTQIQNSILQSRPKTGLSGPFNVWLSNPSICNPAQTLGKVCRYDTSLTKYQSEMIILLTASKHSSHSEFDIHVKEGLDAGISMEFICGIPRDERFCVENVEKELIPIVRKRTKKGLNGDDDDDLDVEKDCVLIQFVTALLCNSGLISDELYNHARAIIGNGKDEVLVEITSIIGYYTYVAYTLNLFRIPSK